MNTSTLPLPPLAGLLFTVSGTGLPIPSGSATVIGPHSSDRVLITGVQTLLASSSEAAQTQTRKPSSVESAGQSFDRHVASHPRSGGGGATAAVRATRFAVTGAAALAAPQA